MLPKNGITGAVVGSFGPPLCARSNIRQKMDKEPNTPNEADLSTAPKHTTQKSGNLQRASGATASLSLRTQRK